MTKQELITKAVDFLRDNPEVFVDSINELDSYSGYADEYRVEPMDFLDDYFSGQSPTEILSHVDSSFSTADDWFYFDRYGDLCSTHDPAAYYENHFDYGDVVDELIEHYGRIDIYSSEFDEIIEALANGDYYDEECEEAPSDADSLPYGPATTSTAFVWRDEE